MANRTMCFGDLQHSAGLMKIMTYEPMSHDL